jgi:hypothetical protein
MTEAHMDHQKRLYAAIQRAFYNIAVRPRALQDASSGVDGWFRLSTFNMPNQVQIARLSTQEICIRFSYPNDEAPERQPRSLEEGEVRVLLGKNSKKILEMMMPATQFASSAGFLARVLAPGAEAGWLRDLPASERFAALRNAQVISAIVDSIPVHSREGLVAKLDETSADKDEEFQLRPIAAAG